ncbi:ABC transporter substrate-binding protein [Acrocarpospora phusangensis]|uniref:ABC transporter substrate-binding protein n=1 Tax=Acrocarpospora phusangensis TaxID=1070424 RepID=A0A919UKW6_9ACTN|nr:ABC transporter substrate-binding protein [Acrocarpospora phusangensis]GIH21738.1 ABC transporter substrate-binding protein [Acrocarpospora phusangensis]
MLGSSRVSKRRPLGAVAALMVVGLTLAGCAGGAPAQNADQGSADSGNITWWGWTPDATPAEAYIKAFNKVYPNIKVTFKKLTIDGYDAAIRPALASSVGPDVFAVAPGAANGSVDIYGVNAVDLKPAVEKTLGADWESKLAPIGVSSLMNGDKLAALSVGSVFSGTIWVNKDLFDKYGLTPPKTYDEWKKVCETFKANNVGCFVQGAAQTAFNEDTLQAITDNVAPGVWEKALKGEVPWTDPAIVQALTIWKKLFDDGIMQEGALGMQQYPDANNGFMSGKYAMVMMGTWYMQYSTIEGNTAAISGAGVADPKPFTQLPIPFPDVAGTGNVGALYGDADFGLAVNQKSKNIAAATTFATWLGTSAEGQQVVADVLNDIPALITTQPNWDTVKLVNPEVQRPALEKLISDSGKSTEPRLATVVADLQTAIGVASTTVAAGEATPEQAAATLQASAAKIK